MDFLKKRKWQVLSSVFLAGLVVCLSFFVAKEAYKQERRGRRGIASTRGPASIQKVFDFSSLQGSALEYAAKQRLAYSISVAKSDQESVIEVGNFVLSNDSNQKDFACGYYDQVTLEFDAEGIAVSGEKPHLTVQTGCDVADNINNLEPIHVPVQKLKAQAPGESEYKFYDAKRPMTVQMVNSATEWPSQWVMTDLRFTNSQFPSRTLHLGSDEIRAGSGKVLMNW